MRVFYAHGRLPNPRDDRERVYAHGRLMAKGGAGVPAGDSKCSAFESVCNLCNLVVGAGLLSMPYAVREAGWFAIVLMFASTAIMGYTLLLITENVLLLKSKHPGSSPVRTRSPATRPLASSHTPYHPRARS